MSDKAGSKIGSHAYCAAGGGRRYRWQDAVVQIKLSPETSPFNQLAVAEMELPARGKADLHACKAIDRLYYCTGGRGKVVIAGEGHAIEEGSFVYCGRALPLAVQNLGDESLKTVACSMPPGPEMRADLVPSAEGMPELVFTAESRRLLGILTASEAADVPPAKRGFSLVLGPDEGMSYWQADPSAGFITRLLGPDNAPLHHISAATQLLEPGAHVREHGHVRHHEVLIAVKGKAVISIDGVEHDFSPGTVAMVGPYAMHSFKNVGDAPSVVYAFSTPSGIEAALHETGVARAKGLPRPSNIVRNPETGRLLVEKYGFIIESGRG